ncbi:phosphate transporter 4 [Prunus dulcis]|uniref:Phosphate transporter 4 n=1 Tax=Prunus dulcis TaxID=3755 RepID=A0A4Y1RPU3_PRUDU|nr:phosphate transporter 4 [Prunus dulcis]
MPRQSPSKMRDGDGFFCRFRIGKQRKKKENRGVSEGKAMGGDVYGGGIERGMLMGNRGGGSGEAAAAKKAISVPERFKVVALLACVMCLCNADRVVMSVAIVPLAAKNGWTSSFLGVVQSSFLWGYIFSSVIGGALVDKYGGKRVMAWGVAMWSLATLLTPWAANHSTTSLLAVRAFFGLAEGVALPSMSTLLSRWFPTQERASAVGISMAGFHIGNVIGLLLTPVMLSSIGISGPFILFSSIGLLWLTIWAYTVTNDPRESYCISKSELRLIQAGKSDSPVNSGKLPPLRLLLSKLPTWTIILANITNNWVFGVNLKQAAWFSAVPWGTMAVSSYIAGAASDSLIKAGYSLTSVRKIMQSIGFIGPGVSLLCLNYANTPTMQRYSSQQPCASALSAKQAFSLIYKDFKFSRDICSHSQHNRNWLFCAMVRIISGIPNCHCSALFRDSNLLEPICYWRACLLD